MTKSKGNTERSKKIIQQCYKLDNYEISYLSKWMNDRKEKLWKKQRENETKQHIQAMKNLTIDTKILITRGRCIGKYGIIKKHGRKYAKIYIEELNQIWKINYVAFTDQIDDSKITSEVKLNAKFQKEMNNLFNSR